MSLTLSLTYCQRGFRAIWLRTYAVIASPRGKEGADGTGLSGLVGSGGANVGKAGDDVAVKQESRWRRLKRLRREWHKKGPITHRPEPTHNPENVYDLNTALQHVRASAWAKFDESVELIFRLNLDPRQAGHNLRGSFSVPHGTGRSDRIAVFVNDEASPEAEAARRVGAHLVGGQSLIQRVRAERGKCLKGFAACLALPEVVPTVAQAVGRILGPKGLLPSPKLGTVISSNVGEDVSQFLRGRVYYRIDKFATLQMNVGKLSFTDDMLRENIVTALVVVRSLKPADVRKGYMKKVVICSSMGPSVKINGDAAIKF